MSEIDPNAKIKRALWVSLWVLCAIVVCVILFAIVLGYEPDRPTVSDLEMPAVDRLTVDVALPDLRFSDVSGTSGIDFVHYNGAEGERLLPETMGGGIAFLDFDNDDDQDVFFVNSQSWPWASEPRESRSALFENDGSGNFARVANSGLEIDLYGMGVAIGDFDGDCYSDVFITAVGKNRLLRNIDGHSFVDVTEELGVGGASTDWSTCATFVDYDRDGDLDLFVCNYVEWSREQDKEVDYRLAGIGRAYGPPTDFAGTNSLLYRNDGTHFTDVSEQTGIQVANPSTGYPVGKALGVVAVDINDDGFRDLVVANDTVRNFAFINHAGEIFVESGIELGLAFDSGGKATGAMGIDYEFTAPNSSLSIAIGNFANEMSSFYVKKGTVASFTDDSIVSGIGAASRSALTFGLIFFDADLDSRQDLIAINGHVEPNIHRVQSSQLYEQPPQLWWNCGADCPKPFVLISDTDDSLTEPIVGRGAAYADIDSDGDLDLVFSAINEPPVLLRNVSDVQNNWIRVSLYQDSPNPFAIGASVTVRIGEREQVRDVERTRSYLSQMELPITVGVGKAETIDLLEVQWPDGTSTHWTELEVNKHHKLSKNKQPFGCYPN